MLRAAPEDVTIEIARTLRECEARAISRVQSKQSQGERTMAQLVSEPEMFLPFDGADADTRHGNAYDLWMRVTPDGEWLFGCACHSPIAAFVCMKYVRATYPTIAVKVRRQ